ncbi:hypothetical protein CK203_103406 [Vitis vinifera]|uniref:Retrotransposon gag domain-containing protein n=1 Tax=Vitis vinifera TaxID=29760 RepID=A0A438BQP2_VITVI|nr:hypothetical protein CK203_103406 [Vitis vinifera]
MEKLLEAQIHEETKLWSSIAFAKSFKVCKERAMERGKQRSQESNASNRVRFGAEMRKIWPSHSCNSLARKYPRKEVELVHALLDSGPRGKASKDRESSRHRVGYLCKHHGPSTRGSEFSQHGQGGNPNAYLSMRDRMHPPRMSAPSCIVPPLEQLIIRPHIVPLLPNFHGMESENHMPTSRSLRRTNGLKRQISNFSAKENEKFHECWERYMEAINACPHHGFDTWLLVSRGWDEPNSREMGKMKAPNPKAGMYMLSEDMDMKAKVATMARRLEELELKKMHEVQAISETQAHVMPCTICQSCDHVVDECPTIPAVREMLGDQANVVGQFRPNNNAPYGNTYNSSWRNHPNFSWKPRPPPYQPQAKPKHLNKPLQWSKPL